MSWEILWIFLTILFRLKIGYCPIGIRYDNRSRSLCLELSEGRTSVNARVLSVRPYEESAI